MMLTPEFVIDKIYSLLNRTVVQRKIAGIKYNEKGLDTFLTDLTLLYSVSEDETGFRQRVLNYLSCADD